MLQEFLNYVKSVFNLRGKSEQLEQQKKRAGSMALLGGAGGSPPPSAGPLLEEREHQQKMGGTFFPRPPPIVRSAVGQPIQKYILIKFVANSGFGNYNPNGGTSHCQFCSIRWSSQEGILFTRPRGNPCNLPEGSLSFQGGGYGRIYSRINLIFKFNWAIFQ
jgi:hypothetical protein